MLTMLEGYEQQHGGYSQQPSYGAPPPAQFGQQQYGQPQYGQQQYGAPQGGGMVPPLPHMPPGWAALWDPVTQRWAWLDHTTSMVNWNGPMHGGGGGTYAGGMGGPDAMRGFGGTEEHKDKDKSKDKSKDGKDKKKDKDGNSKMLVGVAAGGLGGVLLANAFGTFSSLVHPAGPANAPR